MRLQLLGLVEFERKSVLSSGWWLATDSGFTAKRSRTKLLVRPSSVRRTSLWRRAEDLLDSIATLHTKS